MRDRTARPGGAVRAAPRWRALLLSVATSAAAGAVTPDVERGRELAIEHCARCHVIGDYNRMGGLDNSPSFMALTTVPGYEERLRTFYQRRPHPVFVRVKGYERWSTAPAYAPEFEWDVDDIDHLIEFVRTLEDWRPPQRR